MSVDGERAGNGVGSHGAADPAGAVAASARHAGAANARVTVVVLDWNGAADTVRCVRSLAAVADEADVSVLVVDNGSTTPVQGALREAGLDVEVLRAAENLGYAGGNNVGIRAALARGADFVWVLNNDAEATPGSLAALVDAALRFPGAGALAGRVLRGDDRSRVWVAWGEVTWAQSLVRLVGEDAKDGPAWHVERDVEWLPGCALLLRAAALRDVGFFDEDFFAYHEDVDWAARAGAKGWTLRYVGSSVVVHHIHGSSGGAAHYGGFRKYLSARNSVLYALRHGTPSQRLRMGLAIVATFPFQLLRRALSGEAAGAWIKQRGWRDALAGRPIPFEELGLRRDAERD